MKTLLLIVGGLVALLVVGAVVVTFMLDGIVRGGVNRYGPRITQTPVVLEDAQLSLFTGRGSLQGLAVGNPDGWAAGNAFSVGEVQFAVVPQTLWKDPLVIDELVVNQPRFNYEQRLTGGSNIKDLLENVRQTLGAPAERPIGEPEEPARKFIIKRLRLNDATVRVGLGGAAGADVPLPALSYDDLGVAEGGLTGAQIAQVVLSDVLGRVLSVATSSGVLSLPRGANEALEAVGGALQKGGLDRLLRGGKQEAPPPPKQD